MRGETWREIDRRTVLQAGAAMTLAGPLAAALDATPAAAASRIGFHRVLFDRDDPAAVAFGRAGVAAGLPVEPVGRDLTTVWRELALRWRSEPAAIAGLTGEETATYLQHLAQGAGLRVVFRASHTALGDGRMRHYLTGPRATLDQAALLDGEGWPLGALALLRGCASNAGAKESLERVSPSRGPPGERLVSWALAARTV